MRANTGLVDNVLVVGYVLICWVLLVSGCGLKLMLEVDFCFSILSVECR